MPTLARPFTRRVALLAPFLAFGALALSACSDGGGGDSLNPPPGGDFEIALGGVGTLVEGGPDALYVPITLERSPGHDRAVSVTIEGATPADTERLAVDVSNARFEGARSDGGVLMSLSIGTLPIRSGQRRLWFVASDGIDEDRIGVDIEVSPTDAPDIYLLVGQSNMVGFSGEGTRQDEPGGADASDARILQLNVTGNDGFEVFVRSADYVSLERNLRDPSIVIAEDPLHLPQDDSRSNGKDEQYIGLGLSFAKRARLASDADVVLVPAAWSGSSFCANPDGPDGHWNSVPGGPAGAGALGNDLLFERAITRADAAIAASGGVLRGILWHQGESDANEVCAPFYAENLDRLARGLRERIREDRRGAAYRGAEAPVPFVVGTMSRGIDERGDFSSFMVPKQQVDDATRALPMRVAWTAVSNHDDLVPANGYPCGAGSCIHFGAAALREMGRRYHAALERAAARPPER